MTITKENSIETREERVVVAETSPITIMVTRVFKKTDELGDPSTKWEVIEGDLSILKAYMLEDPDVEQSKKTAQKAKLNLATTVVESFYYYGVIKGVGK